MHPIIDYDLEDDFKEASAFKMEDLQKFKRQEKNKNPVHNTQNLSFLSNSPLKDKNELR